MDAFEVATGPADIGGTQNPFTVTAIARYEQLLTVGYKIAAVGSSDSHKAGDASGAARRADRRGAHRGPRRRAVASAASAAACSPATPTRRSPARAGPTSASRRKPHGATSSKRAIIGDTLHATGASFKARVLGGNGGQLLIVKDGSTIATVPVTSDDFVYRFEGSGSGRWRLQVMRGSLIQTVSSPIWIEPGSTGVVREPLPLGRLGGHRPERHAVGDDHDQRQARCSSARARAARRRAARGGTPDPARTVITISSSSPPSATE